MPHAESDLSRPLRLLGLAAFASAASMRWCDALLPVLSDEFSVTAGQSAQVVYAFAIAYGVMQLVYGPLGDRLGKYTVVSFAVLACTVGAMGSALAPGLGWLTLARVVNGAAAAGVIPLAMAWVGDNVPYERRQPVLARLMGSMVLGVIAGQWLSGVSSAVVGFSEGGYIGSSVVVVRNDTAFRERLQGTDRHRRGYIQMLDGSLTPAVR